jgi:GT2 family glycosyltransferase
MFSIIILHHNKAEYSRACLESLLCSSARPLEVINVDNGSQDATAQILDEWEDKAREAGIAIRRLNFDNNIGAIRGRNEAITASSGDYIAFLDNDTIVAQSDWLERLRAFLDADEKRAIVAPKLLFPWAPFAIECCGCGITRGGRVQYVGRGDARVSLSEPFEVQCAISAAWLMPRRLIDSLGALDDAFSPVQYEDLDFCYRAREAGAQVWALPEVELFHFEHTTTAGSGDINFKYVTTKNGILFKKRWSPIFSEEDGPSEADAQWLNLPKQNIEEVNWRTLLPA